jgi:hypothetical protein
LRQHRQHRLQPDARSAPNPVRRRPASLSRRHQLTRPREEIIKAATSRRSRTKASCTTMPRIKEIWRPSFPNLSPARRQPGRVCMWHHVTENEGRILRQHRRRPRPRVDGCRRGLRVRAAVGSTEDRDRYRGRC